ncbi:MAG: hypothetical protein AAGJ08_16280 [Cyanobacteria bacterium P01_H01_bin.35]
MATYSPVVMSINNFPSYFLVFRRLMANLAVSISCGMPSKQLLAVRYGAFYINFM